MTILQIAKIDQMYFWHHKIDHCQETPLCPLSHLGFVVDEDHRLKIEDRTFLANRKLKIADLIENCSRFKPNLSLSLSGFQFSRRTCCERQRTGRR